MLIGQNALLPEDGCQDALDAIMRAVLKEPVKLDLLLVEQGGDLERINPVSGT